LPRRQRLPWLAWLRTRIHRRPWHRRRLLYRRIIHHRLWIIIRSILRWLHRMLPLRRIRRAGRAQHNLPWRPLPLVPNQHHVVRRTMQQLRQHFLRRSRAILTKDPLIRAHSLQRCARPARYLGQNLPQACILRADPQTMAVPLDHCRRRSGVCRPGWSWCGCCSRSNGRSTGRRRGLGRCRRWRGSLRAQPRCRQSSQHCQQRRRPRHELPFCQLPHPHSLSLRAFHTSVY
jgi:hypothetical protein